MLAGCLVMLAATFIVSAGDRTRQAVRMVDTKDLNLGEAKGQVDKPAVLANADELAKAISDPQTVAKIKSQIDFTKEKILYFQWGGSGQDKLSFTMAKGEKALDVVIVYQAGLTRDYRQHHQFVVMPKD